MFNESNEGTQRRQKRILITKKIDWFDFLWSDWSQSIFHLKSFFLSSFYWIFEIFWRFSEELILVLVWNFLGNFLLNVFWILFNHFQISSIFSCVQDYWFHWMKRTSKRPINSIFWFIITLALRKYIELT